MKCEYQDGFKVDYSGNLTIRKGDEVNVFIKEDVIPGEFKGQLDSAESTHSCSDLRSVAESITQKVGNKACLHE